MATTNGTMHYCSVCGGELREGAMWARRLGRHVDCEPRVALRPCLTCGAETYRAEGAVELGNGQRYCAECKATRPRIQTPQVRTARPGPRGLTLREYLAWAQQHTSANGRLNADPSICLHKRENGATCGALVTGHEGRLRCAAHDPMFRLWNDTGRIEWDIADYASRIEWTQRTSTGTKCTRCAGAVVDPFEDEAGAWCMKCWEDTHAQCLTCDAYIDEASDYCPTCAPAS